MFTRTPLALVFLFSLSGCVSVVDSKMVHDTPLVNAKEYVLKASNFKLQASRFDQSFGPYSISKAYASWTSNSGRKAVDSNTQTITVKSDIIDWLIFDSPYPYDYSYEVSNRTYEVNQSSTFGFDIRQGQMRLDVDCANFSLNHQQLQSTGPSGQHSSSPDKELTRVKTFLSCRLNNPADAMVSIFSVEILPDGQFKTEFTNQLKPFSLKSNHSFVVTLSDGSTRYSDNLPSWLRQIAGFSINAGQKHIASVSLMKNPRIWVEASGDLDTALYATAISYSLFIFNDVDSGWDSAR